MIRDQRWVILKKDIKKKGGGTFLKDSFFLRRRDRPLTGTVQVRSCIQVYRYLSDKGSDMGHR